MSARARVPARHEVPTVDAAALETARRCDRMLAACRDRGLERWAAYLAPPPDRLPDEPIAGLRAAARRLRAAYGPQDSIRDVLPGELTEPARDAVDRLLRELDRLAARATDSQARPRRRPRRPPGRWTRRPDRDAGRARRDQYTNGKNRLVRKR